MLVSCRHFLLSSMTHYGGKIIPMTKADRIARENLRRGVAEARRREVESSLRRDAEYLQYMAEIKAEIKAVLRLLEELEYPFMETVSVPSFFGRVTKAGWIVGLAEINPGGRGDGGFSVPIHLLSDGRLCCDDSIGSPKKIICLYKRPGPTDSNGCLKGLQNLRHRLEEMKGNR